MTAQNPRVHFWNHLLHTAELIETLSGSDSLLAIQEQLGTIGEAFGDCADPVEQFEEYVVVKFSLALQAALAAASTTGHIRSQDTGTAS